MYLLVFCPQRELPIAFRVLLKLQRMSDRMALLLEQPETPQLQMPGRNGTAAGKAWLVAEQRGDTPDAIRVRGTPQWSGMPQSMLSTAPLDSRFAGTDVSSGGSGGSGSGSASPRTGSEAEQDLDQIPDEEGPSSGGYSSGLRARTPRCCKTRRTPLHEPAHTHSQI